MGNNPESEAYKNKAEAKCCPIPHNPVTHERLNVLDGKTSARWSFSFQGTPITPIHAVTSPTKADFYVLLILHHC